MYPDSKRQRTTSALGARLLAICLLGGCAASGPAPVSERPAVTRSTSSPPKPPVISSAPSRASAPEPRSTGLPGGRLPPSRPTPSGAAAQAAAPPAASPSASPSIAAARADANPAAPSTQAAQAKSQSTPPPVTPSATKRRATLGADGKYQVQPGDTLYSLAWQFDVDWKRLARHNKIAPPYTIYTGQELKLKLPDAAANATAAGRQSAPKAGRKNAAAPEPAAPAGKPNWRWPLRGRITQRFSNRKGSLNKGLDILGNTGQDVTAAADGRVVYASNWIRGHDYLVIIKHNDSWLSSYAGNNPPQVEEDQRVSAGQVLSKLSGDDERRRSLHFEVRRNGKPVNPEQVLPARR